MADDTLTIALEGAIGLKDFTKAIKCFQDLITCLSVEMAQDKIDWYIDDLQTGSAIATIRGRSNSATSTEGVLRAYVEVGRALQQNEQLEYSQKVRRRANALIDLLHTSNTIESIRFETPSGDALITGQPTKTNELEITYAYGQVKGIVQTLTNRRNLRFTLYDLLYDKPISCYLHPDQQEMIRDVWGRRVMVAGRVGREPMQRRVVVMRDIRAITLLPESSEQGYIQARGILPVTEGSDKPEELIRSIRDAW